MWSSGSSPTPSTKAKDNSLALLYSSVVQLVERLTVNQDGTGSSPVRGAKILH